MFEHFPACLSTSYTTTSAEVFEVCNLPLPQWSSDCLVFCFWTHRLTLKKTWEHTKQHLIKYWGSIWMSFSQYLTNSRVKGVKEVKKLVTFDVFLCLHLRWIDDKLVMCWTLQVTRVTRNQPFHQPFHPSGIFLFSLEWLSRNVRMYDVKQFDMQHCQDCPDLVFLIFFVLFGARRHGDFLQGEMSSRSIYKLILKLLIPRVKRLDVMVRMLRVLQRLTI